MHRAAAWIWRKILGLAGRDDDGNIMVAAIFLATGIAAIGAGPVFSQEMVPIEKYVGQNEFERNPGSCAIRVPTVRFYLCGHLQRDTDLQAQGKVYSESGDKFLSMSESVKPFSQGSHSNNLVE